MRTVFMGSPEFALPTLRGLAECHQLVGVITQPDRPAGRGRLLRPPPAKEASLALGIPVIQPKNVNSHDSIAQIHTWAPEIIIVAAYGQILLPELLDLPRLGCLNIHASLLPRWRGAAPVQAAILNGDDQTGVTIILMDPGMDTGPILAQRPTPIEPSETGGELERRLAKLGSQLLLDILPAYQEHQLQPVPQDSAQATYAPMLRKADGSLDWRNPATTLARQVRAFHPWPSSFFLYKQRRIIVHSAKAYPDHPAEIGRATSHLGWPAVGTSAGILVLEELQLPGKNPIKGEAFMHGARDFDGALLPPPPASP